MKWLVSLRGLTARKAEKIMTPPPVKAEAERHGIPVLQPEKVRLEEEIEKVLSLKPDLIVTAAFGQILPKRAGRPEIRLYQRTRVTIA